MFVKWRGQLVDEGKVVPPNPKKLGSGSVGVKVSEELQGIAKKASTKNTADTPSKPATPRKTRRKRKRDSKASDDEESAVDTPESVKLLKVEEISDDEDSDGAYQPGTSKKTVRLAKPKRKKSKAVRQELSEDEEFEQYPEKDAAEAEGEAEVEVPVHEEMSYVNTPCACGVLARHTHCTCGAGIPHIHYRDQQGQMHTQYIQYPTGNPHKPNPRYAPPANTDPADWISGTMQNFNSPPAGMMSRATSNGLATPTTPRNPIFFNNELDQFNGASTTPTNINGAFGPPTTDMRGQYGVTTPSTPRNTNFVDYGAFGLSAGVGTSSDSQMRGFGDMTTAPTAQYANSYYTAPSTPSRPLVPSPNFPSDLHSGSPSYYPYASHWTGSSAGSNAPASAAGVPKPPPPTFTRESSTADASNTPLFNGKFTGQDFMFGEFDKTENRPTVNPYTAIGHNESVGSIYGIENYKRPTDPMEDNFDFPLYYGDKEQIFEDKDKDGEEEKE